MIHFLLTFIGLFVVAVLIGEAVIRLTLWLDVD